MKIFTRTLFLILVFSAASLSAQDQHFSMFYASPLTLNPALTGVNEGDYRVSGIYRNQWRSISTPYQSYGLSFDIKLLQSKLKNDIFGVGGTLEGDQSGDGKLTMTSGMLSAAFHKGLDKDHHHFLGVGVQFAFTQRSLKINDLAFPEQFDNTLNTFNLMQSNGEGGIKPNINYF
ncbi:MAG TPA: PorP/SprF family type IX secretion system membrane protein, partial [Chitinophagales bacterium]|nr:PorP/SprF family type IX secretion system membrane protein [Chitinophagales bacterium]